MTNSNPFETIDQRLSNIEGLLMTLKHEIKGRPAETPERLMTVQEAADFLSLTVPTIYTKVSREKGFPHLKRGKRVYFLREQLIKYMKGDNTTIFTIK